MESNWRYNVWEQGMSYSDWELSARIPDSMFGAVYVVKRNRTPKRVWYYLYFPGSLPDLLGSTLWTPADGNFPYGNVVDPD